MLVSGVFAVSTSRSTPSPRMTTLCAELTFKSTALSLPLQLAMKACPYRAVFYEKLGPADKVGPELTKWLDALEKIVARLEAFYATNNYAKGL
jgi:hypothetical protein